MNRLVNHEYDNTTETVEYTDNVLRDYEFDVSVCDNTAVSALYNWHFGDTADMSSLMSYYL